MPLSLLTARTLCWLTVCLSPTKTPWSFLTELLFNKSAPSYAGNPRFQLQAEKLPQCVCPRRAPVVSVVKTLLRTRFPTWLLLHPSSSGLLAQKGPRVQWGCTDFSEHHEVVEQNNLTWLYLCFSPRTDQEGFRIWAVSRVHSKLLDSFLKGLQ